MKQSFILRRRTILVCALCVFTTQFLSKSTHWKNKLTRNWMESGPVWERRKQFWQPTSDPLSLFCFFKIVVGDKSYIYFSSLWIQSTWGDLYCSLSIGCHKCVLVSCKCSNDYERVDFSHFTQFVSRVPFLLTQYTVCVSHNPRCRWALKEALIKEYPINQFFQITYE